MNNPEIDYDVTLKFEEGVTQTIGSFKRVFGLVPIRQLVRLINVVDLDSNPRNSRAGSITQDIMQSLERYPDTFPLMSKGILISAMNFRCLERNRYQLRFEDKGIEGVLDGGHNLLAVGLYILGEALASASIKSPVGARITFAEFKKLFQQHFEVIDEYLQDAKNNIRLDHFVPVELVIPASESDADRLAFRDNLPLIQQARNNNAQLKDQTLADHAGIFEELKRAVSPDLRTVIEWKSNDGGRIDVRELIALSWIPFSELDFDVLDSTGKRIAAPSPTQLYSSKATVLNRFVEFMEADSVGRMPVGEKYELSNERVRSAIKLTASLPNLFEQVSEFVAPIFDNADSKMKFADLDVIVAANKRGNARHKFTESPTDVAVPDGFVWPIITGFRALIEQDEDGDLYWGVDPVVFLHDHWRELSDSLFNVLESGQFDPQKVGKSKLSYDLFHARMEAIYRRVN